MTNERDDKPETIQSVALALRVLETIAEASGEMGVTALASALGTTKSRIHRHLRSLVSLGYLAQSESTERYKVGPRLTALGRLAAGGEDLSGVAAPHMRSLRDRTGQAVSLGEVEATGIRILSTVHGHMLIDVGVRPGSLLGFCNSAQGKVALAHMDEAAIRSHIPETIPAATEFTITEPEALVAHIQDVRARGWATAPNETMLGLNALACPVFGADGAVLATIALVSLTQYIATPPDADQVQAVQDAAAQISAELGYVA